MGNAFLVRFQFTTYDPSTGEFIPYTPNNLSCKICASNASQTAIAGLGPFNLQSTIVGEAYYSIPSSAIEALNSTQYINNTVWLITTGTDVKIVTPLTVSRLRIGDGA